MSGVGTYGAVMISESSSSSSVCVSGDHGLCNAARAIAGCRVKLPEPWYDDDSSSLSLTMVTSTTSEKRRPSSPMLAMLRKRASSIGSITLLLLLTALDLRRDELRLRELPLRCARSNPSRDGFESLLSSSSYRNFEQGVDGRRPDTEEAFADAEIDPLGEMEMIDRVLPLDTGGGVQPISPPSPASGHLLQPCPP